MHYVTWNILCKPKNKGGYGLQSLVEKLGPLRSKFALNFIKKPNSLLNRVLKAKYGKELWIVATRSYCSSTWKIILNGAKYLHPVMRWRIFNGVNVDTFKDIWILDKAIDKWPTFVTVLNPKFSQVSTFISDRMWDINKLKHCFGQHLIELIVLIPIHTEDN
ncbi:putative mitochondrial protein [Dendrobium catenatum]|uniref:Putative mitochondrial protein n=1 Tax=Dendrobium catenatum TaxID=906689 RepID=A0A2I0VHW9_9ASPA|nr:putative mitochondrial protein [Dendrobium catenatum]